MRIAIFSSSFYPHLGGVEELVRQLAHAFRASGHRSVVVTNRWPRSLPSYEVVEDIPVHRLPMRVPVGGVRAAVSYAVTTRAVDRQVRAVLKAHRIDVIHVQCISANGLYAARASRDLGLPLVITTQGERTMDAGQIFQRSRYMDRLMGRVLSSADAVTGCSRDTLDDLARHFKTEGAARWRVVPNGVRVTDFAAAEPHAHPRPYVFAMGRLVKQKGFDVLLDAFRDADLPKTDLIIAGDGPELDGLNELATRLGLAGRVLFYGRADRTAVARLMKGCELFVLPSRMEPFGIVVLEAMAAGRPVIASRTGGVPEFVRDGIDGILVPPENSQRLAGALRALVGDAPGRAALGAAACQRSIQFDWGTVANAYLSIYHSVAEIP